VIAADTDEEARRLFTSAQQQFVLLRRGMAGPLPPPRDSMEGFWTPAEKYGVEQMLACTAVGTPDMVEETVRAFLEETGVDELIIAGQIFDHKARLRSFEIMADVARRIAGNTNT